MSLEIDNFDCIPDEVILRIFKYLDAKHLFNIAPVCRRFQRITEDADVWKYVKISDRCSPRLCLHMTNIIFHKPIRNLDISYFGMRQETCCPKESLHSAVIIDDGNSYLNELKFLVHPYHAQRYLTVDLVKRLEKSPNVKVLTCNLHDHKHYSFIFASRNVLEVLKIPYCDYFDKRMFKKLMESCHKLKELYMRVRTHRWYAPFEVDTLPKQICKLTLIYLNYNFISLVDDNVVSAIVSRCPNLVDLNLPYCQVTVKSLEIIAEGLKDLERLTLGCQKILDFRVLKKLRSLKYLAVGINQTVPEYLRAHVEISNSVLCLI